ncbi:MAG: ribosomal-processing cysteine protease Prp [Clostridia bacterium]|nr:ribosomal-processing cysteine protease Prp [Clostridia bacterium]
MITVSILGDYKGFEVDGHSGYAEEGSDIICASVSSAAYMTANTLTEIIGVKADIEVEDGYMHLVLSEENETAKKLIEGFALHIGQLSEQYPDYVIKLH